jgi:hypothetical protein
MSVQVHVNDEGPSPVGLGDLDALSLSRIAAFLPSNAATFMFGKTGKQYQEAARANVRCAPRLCNQAATYPSCLPAVGADSGIDTNAYCKALRLRNGNTISVGPTQAMALRPDGSALLWGRLTTYARTETYQGPYVSVSAGIFAGMALREDGGVDWWQYELTHRPGPYIAVAAGHFMFAAVRLDGSLDIWGTNINIDNEAEPVLRGPFVDVKAYYRTVFALRQDGSVYCWNRDERPFFETEYSGPYVEIAPGFRHVAFLKPNGNVDVFYVDEDERRRALRNNNGPFVSISSGHFAWCGTKKDGSAHFYNHNSFLNQVDAGLFDRDGDRFAEVKLSVFGMGLRFDGTLECWCNEGGPVGQQEGRFKMPDTSDKKLLEEYEKDEPDAAAIAALVRRGASPLYALQRAHDAKTFLALYKADPAPLENERLYVAKFKEFFDTTVSVKIYNTEELKKMVQYPNAWNITKEDQFSKYVQLENAIDPRVTVGSIRKDNVSAKQVYALRDLADAPNLPENAKNAWLVQSSRDEDGRVQLRPALNFVRYRVNFISVTKLYIPLGWKFL